MRLISGTTKSTSIQWLLALPNILSLHLRRQRALLHLYITFSLNKNLTIHQIITKNRPKKRFESRIPVLRTVIELVDHNFRVEKYWKIG